MAAVPMRTIWQARRLVSQGVSVKNVACELQVTESLVRNYTKAERAMLKNKEHKVSAR